MIGFRHAFRGVGQAVRSELNIRIHFAAAFAVMLLAYILGFDALQWAILALTAALVIVAELLNTAVEAVVDLVTDEFDPLARRAKDAAAGAVLMAAATAVVVGLLLFGPHLRALVMPG